MLDKLTNWLKSIGLDRTTAFSVMGKLWLSVASLLSMVAVVGNLSPKSQGYYYTFSSLITLQIVAEMGLTFVINQFASHEAAHINLLDKSRKLNDSEARAKQRLSSLLVFTVKWFSGASIGLICLLTFVGSYVFNETGNGEPKFIKLKWMLLVLSVSGNLIMTAVASFLEGCGWRENIAKMRFIQSVVASSALWFMLFSGGELYSIAVSNIISFLSVFFWIGKYYWEVLVDVYFFKSDYPVVKWKTEILPFQWRICVSWISGFLSFQAFSPILFKYQGAVAAGQMGMSLQLSNAIGALAMSWITTRLPIFGGLVSKMDYVKLKESFSTAAIQSIAVQIFGSIAIISVVLIMGRLLPEYSNRILPLKLFVIVVFISFLNHLSGIMGAFMRVHKRDPLVFLSILNGIVTASLTLILAMRDDLEMVVIGYLLVAFFVGLIGTGLVFAKFTRIFAKTGKELQFGGLNNE